MPKSFISFFEQYENHHSFLDLINLCKELSDYIYNNDIENSDFFKSFTESKDGYTVIFDKNDKDDYFIKFSDKSVVNQSGDNQIIDRVYEEMENLYDSIKNEILINIKQLDEKKISINDIDPYGEENWDYENGNENINFKLNESFEDELKDKISDKYLSLKKGILKLLDDTLDGDITGLKEFIDEYIEPDSDEVLDGFIEDAEIFDFYLKYQADIDQILLDKEYYDDKPGVESLYDYVIDGTYDAVVYCMEDIRNDIYKKENE